MHSRRDGCLWQMRANMVGINSLIDFAAAWAAALSFRGILSMVGRYAGDAQMGRNSCFAKGRSFSGGPTNCKHSKHEIIQTRQTLIIPYDVIRSSSYSNGAFRAARLPGR